MIAKRRLDANQLWFPEARFGVFIHFGLYALLGRGASAPGALRRDGVRAGSRGAGADGGGAGHGRAP